MKDIIILTMESVKHIINEKNKKNCFELFRYDFIFDQKLFNDNLTIDECEKQLEKVTKQDVIEASRGVKINTIYFLEK